MPIFTARTVTRFSGKYATMSVTLPKSIRELCDIKVGDYVELELKKLNGKEWEE